MMVENASESNDNSQNEEKTSAVATMSRISDLRSLDADANRWKKPDPRDAGDGERSPDYDLDGNEAVFPCAKSAIRIVKVRSASVAAETAPRKREAQRKQRWSRST